MRGYGGFGKDFRTQKHLEFDLGSALQQSEIPGLQQSKTTDTEDISEGFPWASLRFRSLRSLHFRQAQALRFDKRCLCEIKSFEI